MPEVPGIRLDALSSGVNGFPVDPRCLNVRRRFFPDIMTFHGPGLKMHKTSEFEASVNEFVSISVTGTHCALNCEHCKTKMLEGMLSLPRFAGSLFGMCSRLNEHGTRGILVSGGSDLQNRVPLLPYIPDMIRVRKELGMVIRVHPGLPDEETCCALAEVDVDGVMLDIIGDERTIREVYHLDLTPRDYETVLERLERYTVPAIPHIILGHHFGKMSGEWTALDMIQRHPPKVLVLVILMPLVGTGMADVAPPAVEEIGAFFETARLALPKTHVILGCARPLGPIKREIDRLAVDAGLNGIAYPAEGTVTYSRNVGFQPRFVNACCGVTW